MQSKNGVLTFNGVMEYQLWAGGAGSQTDILHVTERGGQLVITYRGALVAPDAPLIDESATAV